MRHQSKSSGPKAFTHSQHIDSTIFAKELSEPRKTTNDTMSDTKFPDTLNFWGHRLSNFFCLLTLIIAATGCTSVQWRDNNGMDHHLGLMAYEVSSFEYGIQLKRVSFGIDLRLSGPARGISIGAKRITGLVPQVRMVERPKELMDEVLDFYRHTPNGQRQTQSVRSGVFYLTEGVSSEITMVDTDNFGFDWRRGPANYSINLGYGGSRQLVGKAIADGIVQIHLEAGDNKNAEAIKLWAFKSDSLGKSND